MTHLVFRLIPIRWLRRVPLVLQYEQSECLPAALSMLMRYWGLYKPLGDIRIACGSSSVANHENVLQEAANSFGFDCEVQQISSTSSSITLASPYILICNSSRLLVCEGISFTGRYVIADPANGRYSLSRKELKRLGPTHAITLTPGRFFKPQAPAGTNLLLLARFFSALQTPIILCLLTTALLAIPNAANPALADAFINEFLLNQRLDYGIPILWLSVLMLGITVLINLLNRSILRRVMLWLQRRVALAITTKILTVDYSFFLTRLRGDLASRLILGLEASNIMTQQIISTLLSLAGAILMIPIVMIISWQLSLATFCYVILNILIVWFEGRTSLSAQSSMQIELGQVGGMTTSLLNEIEAIKASCLEHAYLSRWLSLFAYILEKDARAQSRSDAISTLITLVDSVYEYGTIVLAGLLIMQGRIDLAGFMAFQVMRAQVINPLLGLSQLSSSTKSITASITRLNDLFTAHDDARVSSVDIVRGMLGGSGHDAQDRETEQPLGQIKELQLSGKVNSRKAIRSIQIKGLSHRFSSEAPAVLSEIDLDIEPGSMLTVIGPSGAGKSTLLKLIAGLYTPARGEILYDGRPWMAHPDPMIRQSIGYVSQEFTCLRGTLEENITLWQARYTLDDIRYAAKVACFDNIAMATRRGYRTFLQDGAESLSGGELQRLELTRALLKKPSILLLDEVTSALDVPTEIELLKNLQNLGITLICVAHRLVTAEMSDIVLVLENGFITSFGRPNDIAADSALYQRLKRAEEIL